MSEGRFSRKTALVTGAAQGIGRAIATRFAQEGANVLLVDIDGALAEQTAAELRAEGAMAEAFACDIADRASSETDRSLELRTRDRQRKLISKIDDALRRIDDGEYGYCEETGEEIGLERLEARPIATLCFDAQERWEHLQKQMGD